MAVTFLIAALCLALATGCEYEKNPGLLPNGFQDPSDSTVVETGRQTDTDTTYGNFIDLMLSYPVDIHQADELNYAMRVCDNGLIVFAADTGSLPDCLDEAEVQGIDAMLTNAVVIADFLQNVTGASYEFELYNFKRSEQLDAMGNIEGPSFCDVLIVEGILEDCEESHRQNMSLSEATVVTWHVVADMDIYNFQAVIAVSDMTNRTFVAFLYDETYLNATLNEIAKGEVHAANGLIGGGETRYSKICNSDDENLHEKSNCRCAQRGHYVFETTEVTEDPHGFCGSASDTCENQDITLDDSMTINRNCKNATEPQDSCDVTYYCRENATTKTVVIYVKNFDADRLSFLDFDAYAMADGNTGFMNPHGDNIQPLDPSGSGNCTEVVYPSNTTFVEIKNVTVGKDSRCYKFNATENAVYFVFLLWKSVDGINVTSDGVRIVVGKCDYDDLPEYINTTDFVQDVSDKTTVPTATDRALTLSVWDRKDPSTRQIIQSGDPIVVGRYIFFAICYTKGSQFVRDVDPYGVYGFSCYVANNPYFMSSGDNKTIMVIGSDGCLPGSIADNQRGYLADPFEAQPGTNTTSEPFCIVAGGMAAFRWTILDTKLYLRCYADLCTNTQLFEYSKCADSCNNTIVNVNKTDADDRRRRDVEGIQELSISFDIVDPDPTPINNNEANTKECVEPAVAKGVIGALVATLILATVLTFGLFWMLQNVKNKRKM